MKIGSENFLFERMFLPTKKNINQKLHTGPLGVGDQRRAHSVSKWSKIFTKQLCLRTLSFCRNHPVFVRNRNQWEKISFLKKKENWTMTIDSQFIDLRKHQSKENWFLHVWDIFRKKYFKRNPFKFCLKRQKHFRSNWIIKQSSLRQFFKA